MKKLLLSRDTFSTNETHEHETRVQTLKPTKHSRQ